jgi:peptidoglycan/LPS O-acetylase OafA/YrhL
VPGRRELDPLGANGTGRVLPISSIRFVLAMWVVLAHFSIPILRDHKQMDILGVFRALVNTAFNGPAAVIVFFVISGFCIHFPNRNGLVMRSWKLYYARRYLRTLIPMMAALGLALPLKVPFGLFSDSVLWSLLCEEIYYFLSSIALLAGSNWMAIPDGIVLGSICHYSAHGSSCNDLPIVWCGLELDPRPTVLAYGMQTSGAS